MKYITMLFIVMTILLSSCSNAKANTYQKNNDQKINEKFYFNADNAYNYIKKQTDLGPRNYGSEAHKKVREFFKQEISNIGYEVYSHNFEAPYIKERNGENIYAFLKGKTDDYVIITSHFDSRSVAEKDPVQFNRDKPISGANDGASSSGVLLELMKALKNYDDLPYSVCFVLFDLEDDGNLFDVEGYSLTETDWIQGSIAFVNEIIIRDKLIDKQKIKFGILLDMVGSKTAKFKYESFAHTYYSSIYNQIWNYANDLGYKEYFVDGHYGTIIDDHTPFLNEKIPFIDVIDMGYPFHHTSQDTIDKLDKKTLEAVGKTIEYSIKNADKIY
ncbi:M28 family peptidase [Brachyspira hyodysenteriae]|uniref:Peptidase n=1 Tax=Brachyspira hyodysenteriae ATCC 27164 TaxID=1266923 RepID=A0A3B6VSE3_BRAHO|nr:M28 family peptidase [Brachyspira hyodysenteriae]ANN63961.1 peptidase [Brachyspira hyodysenteriae ATCC 27164]KLI26591.1 peptidase [Brachyspira hyodysenteriae]KLI46864.1 peptidase [Brachyspira hyodysenteriae]MBT8720829.1 M28 family peptidase [Brachyspira hyodysenteriae]MBT8731086.1 M28 family peptidase [Brachyspira hyodysenteriae]